MKNADIEKAILEATRVPGIKTHLDGCREKNPDREPEIVDEDGRSVTRSKKVKGSTNKPKEPARTPKLADLSQ